MQSEEILRANLSVLEKSNPDLAKQLSAPDLKTSAPALFPNVSLETGRKGLPTLRCEDAKGSFYLHSMYDPVREAEQHLDREFDAEKVNVVALLGFGLGYTVESLLNRIDDKTTIVVVEPDPTIVQLAASSRDMAPIFSCHQVKWVVGHDPDLSVGHVVQSLNLEKLKDWTVLLTPAMMRRYLEFSKPFVHKLGSMINAQKVGHATRLAVSELFMRNALINLPYAAQAPGVLHFENKWLNRPVIIVSSGPSLEKQLPALKKVQDRFLLIAAGSAWKALRSADIEPHFVVAVDPFEGNYKHFNDIESRGAYLLADTACNTDIVRTFKNKRIFAHSTTQMDATFEQIYGTRGVLDSGGSVANTAFSFARLIGASPIILLGQDLAYTGGISHAPGHVARRSIELQKQLKPSETFRDIPGYYGDTVTTDSKLDVYRYWFERTISINSDLNVINATEGGAKIEGAKQMPFLEVIAHYSTDHPIEIESLWPDDFTKILVPIEITRENLLNVVNELSSIKRLTYDGMKTAQRLLEYQNDPQVRRTLNKELNSIEKRLQKRKNAGKNILNAFLQQETFNAIRLSNFADDDSEKHYQISANLHRNLHKGSILALDAVSKLAESI